MLTMTNRELNTFVDVSIPRHTMLDFKVEDAIVVGESEGFGVDCFGVCGCGWREDGADVGI